MQLTFRREPAHEHEVRKMYERAGMDPEATPVVFYGYDAAGRDRVHALVSREDLGVGVPDLRWHISVSAAGRVPSWEEVAHTCHSVRPGVPFVFGVPPKSWWLNIHPHVLHVWESKDANLLNSWRESRRGDTPT